MLRSVTPGQQVVKIVNDALMEMLGGENAELNTSVSPPAVIMMVGLQGSGKTTTTGKLARVLVADGRRVLLGAADTFRAAAADQLQTWGERVGAEIVRGKEQADPAAVAFDAVDRGIATGVDVVMIDTAGRLQNKRELMDELAKIRKVLGRLNPEAPHDVVLVLDATNGQNALNQIDVFKEVAGVTGLVMTKLDVLTGHETIPVCVAYDVDGEVSVEMRRPRLGDGSVVRLAGRDYPGTVADIGNPHLVCPVDDVSTVDFREPPQLDAAVFPESANVEVVAPAEPVEGTDVHVRMRVYERGSAETLACGTGACAVMVAAAQADSAPRDTAYRVDLPGGTLRIEWTADDRVLMTGPAVLVAEGYWLAGR